jgi:hypothetical protein
MREDAPESFLDVFKALDASHVRYVAVSGVVVVLRGYVRAIADLDLVVDPEPANAALAVQTLLQLSFAPSIPVPIQALTVLRMFDPSQREVDLFFRYHIPFGQLWASSELLTVSCHPVRAASLDHLLQVKRLLSRPHDLLDVQALAVTPTQNPRDSM